MSHENSPRKRGGTSRDGRAWTALLAFVGLGLGAGPDPRRFEFVETHMGSPFRIVLYTESEEIARRASRAAFDRIHKLDACYSDYDPESELSRLSDKAGGPAVPVSDDLFDILALSKRYAELSDGAFDPTIAPVGRLWRRARRERKLPDPELLSKARKLVGHERLILDPAAKTARLVDAGMRLDLGGIAKGYAAQAAIDVLTGKGIESALVGGAGDIAASGPPPGKAGWTIAVADPANPADAPPTRFVELARAAVSTSGDAERFVEIGGVRYSHIVDPKTGVGVTTRGAVSIVAKRGAQADAIATACSVVGPEKALELARKEKVECLVITMDGDKRKEWTNAERLFGSPPK